MDVGGRLWRGTPDDDLPGLVVLSEKGIGLVLDPDFNPPAVPMLRNLAGLVSSVSYELSDWTRRTTITAHFNVPRGALAPFVKIDNCVGDVAKSTGEQVAITGAIVQRQPFGGWKQSSIGPRREGRRPELL